MNKSLKKERKEKKRYLPEILHHSLIQNSFTDSKLPLTNSSRARACAEMKEVSSPPFQLESPLCQREVQGVLRLCKTQCFYLKVTIISIICDVYVFIVDLQLCTDMLPCFQNTNFQVQNCCSHSILSTFLVKQ